jgi:hypothetical protein
MGLKIYNFYMNFGRMGHLSGMFVVNDSGEKQLKDLIESKTKVYFGEVLGKHSEVYTSIPEDSITPVEATENEVEVVCRVLGVSTKYNYSTITGFNPLDYLDRE